MRVDERKQKLLCMKVSAFACVGVCRKQIYELCYDEPHVCAEW